LCTVSDALKLMPLLDSQVDQRPGSLRQQEVPLAEVGLLFGHAHLGEGDLLFLGHGRKVLVDDLLLAGSNVGYLMRRHRGPEPHLHLLLLLLLKLPLLLLLLILELLLRRLTLLVPLLLLWLSLLAPLLRLLRLHLGPWAGLDLLLLLLHVLVLMLQLLRHRLARLLLHGLLHRRLHPLLLNVGHWLLGEGHLLHDLLATRGPDHPLLLLLLLYDLEGSLANTRCVWVLGGLGKA